jgi:hypothetical protein
VNTLCGGICSREDAGTTFGINSLN